jgi:nitrogen regulatory protein PII 2
MKEVMAVIRMRMMNKTKQALAEASISSITAKDVLGRGNTRVDPNLLEGANKGHEEAIALLGAGQRLVAKRTLSVIVPDKLVQKTVKTIMKVNQTGQSGDGRIFVMPVMDAIRIRTGESGDAAIDEV